MFMFENTCMRLCVCAMAIWKYTMNYICVHIYILFMFINIMSTLGTFVETVYDSLLYDS